MEYAEPRHYVVPRLPRVPVITGLADDAVWEDVPWSHRFVDIEGDGAGSPPYETRFKLAWDDNYLYLAAVLEEPHIWATYTEHDSIIFHENDFEMFVSPTGDNHNYYEWEVNALGTTFDLFMARPYLADCRNDNSWEIPGLLLEIAHDGTINDPSDTDSGWMLEAAFPWDSFNRHPGLRKPSVGDRWRMNFSRVQWDLEIESGQYLKKPNTEEHNWVWSPQGVIDMHRPWKWGYVQFSEISTDNFIQDPDWKVKQLLGDWFVSEVAGRRSEFGSVDWEELGIERTGEFEAKCLGESGCLWQIASDSQLKRL